MKSVNKEKVQKAFTEQASKFASNKMNFTKQEYLDYTITKMLPKQRILSWRQPLEIARVVYRRHHLIHPYQYDFELSSANKSLINRSIEVFRFLDSGKTLSEVNNL